jgi:hypothetical protein
MPMLTIMRLLMLLALLTLGPGAAAADQNRELGGAWIAWLCPPGIQNDPGKCSSFVLELFQKQDKLCGAHVFATAGAGQLDEGAAPSLTGTITDGIAVVVVQSSRATPPIQVRVELSRVEDRLQWRRLEEPAGDYLLPLSTQLKKSRHGTLFSPIFENNLRAACAAIFNVPDDSGAPQAPRPAS